ncbi:hypothetical protein [Clostridium polynesiense]|nr:hypothetical protein [Clostridium polynesiense]
MLLETTNRTAKITNFLEIPTASLYFQGGGYLDNLEPMDATLKRGD